MKRSTPLVRTAFHRKEPSISRSEHPRAKAARCKFCKRALGERERGIHTGCVDGWYAANREKIAKRAAAKKARAERDSFKVRKEKIKTVTEWEHDCLDIVQAIARIRDRNDGCISCHVGPNYSGRWHGSHYRSVGACSNTQFNLWNIHKSCAQCNLHKSGNREFYRPRLIEKIGIEKVEWLDAQNDVVKRSGPAYIEYLKRFRKVMGKRLRRAKRRALNQLGATT